MFANTSDALVGYRRVGGLEGGTLVHDLATSIPFPTDGGPTYRSISDPASTIRPASPPRQRLPCGVERAFTVGSPDGPDHFIGIIGAGACSKARCDLSRGIETDDRAGTVTFRLRAPDPEFLYRSRFLLPIRSRPASR